MNKPTLYIMTGLAFSGKSTLAKEIANKKGAVLVSQDLTWIENEELIKDMQEPARYEKVLSLSEEKIVKTLRDGKSVVFDNTNAQYRQREKVRELIKDIDAKTIVVFLNTPEEIIENRIKENLITQERNDVLLELMDEVKNQFEAPSPDENVTEFIPGTNLSVWLEELQ
jgi:predicted kinase